MTLLLLLCALPFSTSAFGVNGHVLAVMKVSGDVVATSRRHMMFMDEMTALLAETTALVVAEPPVSVVAGDTYHLQRLGIEVVDHVGEIGATGLLVAAYTLIVKSGITSDMNASQTKHTSSDMVKLSSDMNVSQGKLSSDLVKLTSDVNVSQTKLDTDMVKLTSDLNVRMNEINTTVKSLSSKVDGIDTKVEVINANIQNLSSTMRWVVAVGAVPWVMASLAVFVPWMTGNS